LDRTPRFFVGVSDFQAQANQVFENLKLVVGCTFVNVVKVTRYIPNWTPETHRPALAAARDACTAPDALPTSTLLGVQSLARPEYMIGIDAIAAID
jgi:enamine deaminase RidA (YjgF/YER057c/UK114 family)